MYGYIYKTTNIVNGKIYIGQKKSNRFLGADYLGSGKYLRCAVQHYGVENFTVELLATADNKEMLDTLEVLYISEYNATDYTIGYNIANGAVGGDTYTNLSETDKKLRLERFSQHHTFSRGYKRIHKGCMNKAVPQDTLSDYLNNGWELGFSEDLIKRCAEGRKHIKRTVEWNTNIKNGLLSLPDEEKERLRKLHSESTRRQMMNTPKEERIRRARNANKFTGHKCRFVCRGKEVHFVYESDVQKYLNEGFILGMRDKRNDKKSE